MGTKKSTKKILNKSKKKGLTVGQYKKKFTNTQKGLKSEFKKAHTAEDELKKESKSELLDTEISSEKEEQSELVEEALGVDGGFGDPEVLSKIDIPKFFQRDDEEEEDMTDLHKQELELLKKSDPEFYKHLMENDSELLEFGNSDDENVDMESESSPHNKREQTEIPLAESLERDWKELQTKVLDEHSLRALQRLLILYRNASRAGESFQKKKKSKEEMIDDEDKSSEVLEAEDQGMLQAITHGQLYHKIMHFCLVHMHDIFAHHIGYSDDDSISLEKLPGWKKLNKIVQSYVGNTIHFLGNVSEPKMARFVVSKLIRSSKYISALPKLSSKLLKILLKIWYSSEDSSLRIDAFLLIRSLALDVLVTRPSFLDDCLKGLYLTFIRSTRFMSPAKWTSVQFMINCIVEMYGIVPRASYQHVFVYLRQLAIYLRNAVINGKEDDMKAVYNWQYLNGLRVWVAVLCNHGATQNSELNPLIYPTIQILIGLMQKSPAARYLPLRLWCIRLLNDLAKVTKYYIPIAPYLFKCLEIRILHSKPEAGAPKPPALRYLFKASKSLMGSKVFQDSALTETLSLLREFFTLYSYNIAFPELSVAALKVIQGFLKDETVSARCKKSLKLLSQHIKHNADWISKKRKTVTFAPKDIDQANAFLGSSSEKSPLDQYSQCSKEAKLAEDGERTVIRQSTAFSIDNDNLSNSKDADEQNDDSAENDKDTEDHDENMETPLDIELMEDVVEDFVMSDADD